MESGKEIMRLIEEIEKSDDKKINEDIWVDTFHEALEKHLYEIGSCEESVMGYFATGYIEREFSANHFSFLFINLDLDNSFFEFALMGYKDFFKKLNAYEVLKKAITLAKKNKKEIEKIKQLGESDEALKMAVRFEQKKIFSELDEEGDRCMFIRSGDRVQYVLKNKKDFLEFACSE